MISSMPRIAIAVKDFPAALATFGDGLGMPVLDLSDSTVPGLGASVALCRPPGGSNIEIMAPASADQPLAASLQRFLDRRGEGLYALMLEAPDPDAEAEALAERGLEVLPLMAGAGGRDVHPASTHGVLIRVYPDGSVGDGPMTARSEPYLSGITRVIVATTDAIKAADVYGRGFGLEVGQAVDDGERGVLAVACRAPAGGTIELVSVTDGAKPFARSIDRFVTERKPGMFALVLRADDPHAAAELLAGRDLGPGAQVIGGGAPPELTVFGTRLIIE